MTPFGNPVVYTMKRAVSEDGGVAGAGEWRSDINDRETSHPVSDGPEMNHDTGSIVLAIDTNDFGLNESTPVVECTSLLPAVGCTPVPLVPAVECTPSTLLDCPLPAMISAVDPTHISDGLTDSAAPYMQCALCLMSVSSESAISLHATVNNVPNHTVAPVYAALLTDILPGGRSDRSDVICLPCSSLLGDVHCCDVKLQQARLRVRQAYSGGSTSSSSSTHPIALPSLYRQVDSEPRNNEDVTANAAELPENELSAVRMNPIEMSCENDRTTSSADTERAPASQPTFRCDECSRCFTQKHSLRAHRRIHTDSRPYQCPLCARGFRDSCALKKHALIHSDQRPHQCHVCGSRFRQRGVLVRHIRTHTGDRPHRCPLCAKAFIERNSLLRHQVSHGSADKPYHCQLCDKHFSDRYWFVRHEMRHRGELPHRCSVCDARFTDARVLRNHTRRCHRPTAAAVDDEGIGPGRCSVAADCSKGGRCYCRTRGGQHRCTMCAASFSSRAHLARHVRTHTGVRPHRCDLCGLAFAERYTLRRHCVRVHRDDTASGIPPQATDLTPG